MKLKKTPMNMRSSYTYYCANGDRIVLEVGKTTTIKATGERSVIISEEITDVIINECHKFDDQEVEENLKQINTETQAEARERRKLKKQWDEEHTVNGQVIGENPYADIPRRVRIDSNGEYRDDKNKILAQVLAKEIEDPFIVEIREFVETLPQKYQFLYKYRYIYGYKQIEISREFGIPRSTVSDLLKELDDIIYKKFKKN